MTARELDEGRHAQLVAACKPWELVTMSDGYPSSVGLTAEEIAAKVAPLVAGWLAEAEAGALDAVIERADEGIEFGPENFRRLARIVNEVRRADRIGGGDDA